MPISSLPTPLSTPYGKAAFPPEMRVDGEAFVITNDEPVLFWELYRAIAASVGRSVKMEDVKVVPD